MVLLQISWIRIEIACICNSVCIFSRQHFRYLCTFVDSVVSSVILRQRGADTRRQALRQTCLPALQSKQRLTFGGKQASVTFFFSPTAQYRSPTFSCINSFALSSRWLFFFSLSFRRLYTLRTHLLHWQTKASFGSILLHFTTSFTRGAGIACWLERRTRDRKVASSNLGRSGGRIFFSRVNFVC